MKNTISMMIGGALMLMLSGCFKKDSRAILEGKSFYYAEPCSENTVCLNTFGKDHFAEIEYVNGKKSGEYKIGIQYHKEGLFIADGKELFPCHVSDKEEYVMLLCKYEKEEGMQRLWRSKEDAIENKLPCDDKLMLRR